MQFLLEATVPAVPVASAVVVRIVANLGRRTLTFEHSVYIEHLSFTIVNLVCAIWANMHLPTHPISCLIGQPTSTVAWPTVVWIFARTFDIFSRKSVTVVRPCTTLLTEKRQTKYSGEEPQVTEC